MEREKTKRTLNERLGNVRERAQKYGSNMFWFEEYAPFKKDQCSILQVSEEEVSTILPLLKDTFGLDMCIVRMEFVANITPENEFVFGVHRGKGKLDGKDYNFQYIFKQNCEFSGVRMSCKDSDGKGKDNEIYPVLNLEHMPEYSQELLSCFLDIAEGRLV